MDAMNEAQALKLLWEIGALKKGHFLLKSGAHSDTYMDKDTVFPDTFIASQIGEQIADRCVAEQLGIDIVVAPAVGAIALAQWVAHHLRLMTGQKILAIYAEKQPDGSFAIGRSFGPLIDGKKALVVEDVLTTGGSAQRVVVASQAAGGTVVGAAVLCNRGGVTADALGVPWLAWLTTFDKVDAHTYGADCPLCASGVPFNTDLGHGKEAAATKS